MKNNININLEVFQQVTGWYDINFINPLKRITTSKNSGTVTTESFNIVTYVSILESEGDNGILSNGSALEVLLRLTKITNKNDKEQYYTDLDKFKVYTEDYMNNFEVNGQNILNYRRVTHMDKVQLNYPDYTGWYMIKALVRSDENEKYKLQTAFKLHID